MTGAVRSAILATAGLLVLYRFCRLLLANTFVLYALCIAVGIHRSNAMQLALHVVSSNWR